MDSTPYFNELLFPVGLSLFCGALSAILNIPWGMFWGWALSRKSFRGKVILQTILYLPLVLPPVLTGYFLLIVLGRNAVIGQWLYETFSFSFVLNWKGALLASMIVGGPFMIESMRQAFDGIDARLEMAARGLGASSWRVFWTITMPLARPSLLAGFFLVFARSMGEFGATIMVAGNIPGKTQTIPLAIFSQVYMGHEEAVWPLVIAAVFFSYLGLALSNYYNRKKAGG